MMCLFDSLKKTTAPIYERRQELESRKQDVVDILEEGAKKARVVASATMKEVREAMKI
jgi:tryptophanyl-tRNA synthetase